MIKNIVFDFGNVLVQYDFMRFLSPEIGSEERTQEFLDKVINEYWIARIDREDVPLEVILDEMKEANPEFVHEIECFGNPIHDYVTQEVPGMFELLSDLKAKGYRLFGLSNWCHVVYSVIPKYKVFSLLEGQVISSDEKIIKPEPEIYHRLLEKFGLKAEECIFVDDKKINIDAAESCGIHGIVFKNADQLKNELIYNFNIGEGTNAAFEER